MTLDEMKSREVSLGGTISSAEVGAGLMVGGPLFHVVFSYRGKKYIVFNAISDGNITDDEENMVLVIDE